MGGEGGGLDAGPPQESAAICFKSSILSNGGGVLLKLGERAGLVAAQKKNGSHHVKAGGWVGTKRFSCLLSGGRRSS